MNTSDCIKASRKKAGLTQQQLAKKAGLSISSIQGYEQDKYKPKIETLRRIASALNVGLESLMSEAELSLFESMAQLYLKSDDEIEELESLDGHTTQEKYLMVKFRELNDEGQMKATDYIDDLSQIPKYRKDTQD